MAARTAHPPVLEARMIKDVGAKLHGIKVTWADIGYPGSISLDPVHCRRTGSYPLELAYIWSKYSGQRISTYVICGEEGANCCTLNYSTARTCQAGDK